MWWSLLLLGALLVTAGGILETIYVHRDRDHREDLDP